MNRHRLSPLRLLEEWEHLYYSRGCWDDEALPIPKRVLFAWWCERQIGLCRDVWHTLTVRGDAAFNDHSEVAWYESFFYRTKAVICLVIGRDGGDLDNDAGYKRMLESFAVVDYGHQEYMTSDGDGGCCWVVHVGQGAFKNWYAYVDRESWP